MCTSAHLLTGIRVWSKQMKPAHSTKQRLDYPSQTRGSRFHLNVESTSRSEINFPCNPRLSCTTMMKSGITTSVWRCNIQCYKYRSQVGHGTQSNSWASLLTQSRVLRGRCWLTGGFPPPQRPQWRCSFKFSPFSERGGEGRQGFPYDWPRGKTPLKHKRKMLAPGLLKIP